MKRNLLLLLLGVAFWPVVRWYSLRLFDGGDEPWGIAALISALLILLCGRKVCDESQKQVPIVTFVLLGIYGVSFHLLPPLLRAVLAVVTVSHFVQVMYIGKRVELSILSLFILSLPIISSLQFFCGYPLRALSAVLSAEIITLTGYPTVASGTLLHWAGEVISIDSPCSGIKMLWSGLFANFFVAAILQSSNWVTWLSYWFTSFVVFSLNLIRVTILFYTESQIIQAPDSFHQILGMITFLLALVFILFFHRTVKGEVRC